MTVFPSEPTETFSHFFSELFSAAMLKAKETITALSKKINYWKIRLTLCPRKFLNVETVRTLHFLRDEYDDLTASIYVLVQLKQITHCLNALSSQVEPDAEEYSYQFSVKIIGVPEISF